MLPGLPESLLRLVMAMIVGGAVGLEREYHDRPAGLRTHILVCVGSCLIMLISAEVSLGFAGEIQSDPARIAAQVVSGIGFLGAGTILREGVTVRGLTTAASLWIVAALGLGAGAGLYVQTVAAVVITLVSLSLLSQVELYVALKRNAARLTLVARDRPGLIGEVGDILGEKGINIRDIRMKPQENDRMELTVLIDIPTHVDRMALLDQLESMSDVGMVELKQSGAEGNNDPG